MTLYEVDAAANRIREEVDSRRQHHLRLDLRQLAPGPDAGLGGGDRHRPAGTTGATAAQAPVQEPVAEAPRAGRRRRSGSSRSARQAVPFPSQTEARRRAGRASSARPCTCARPAEQPGRSSSRPDLPTAGRGRRADAPAVAAAARRGARRQPVRAGEGVRLHPRDASARSSGSRRASASAGSAPLGDGQAALSGQLDELGDIPSFLRRERERVDG